MSLSKNVLKTQKTGLFKPKIKRIGDTAVFSNPLKDFENIKNYSNTNIESSSSFRYGDKKGIVSTQELNIDYSQFENHTFFHSAVAKTNEAFDKIINKFPFEGDQKIKEEFEDNLTGFEKYVYDTFPKNIGYLNFSASNATGPHIEIKDGTGTKFTDISHNKKSEYILNPDLSPFTIEMHIKIPKQSNDKQIIFQRMSSKSNNITLALSESADSNSCNLVFGITSGSNWLFTTGSISKGIFHHIAAIYDKENDISQKLILHIGDNNVYTSSISQNFGKLNYSTANTTIGSGSSVLLEDTSPHFTPVQTLTASIDELRFFKEKRSLSDLSRYKNRSLNKNVLTSNENNLIFYYKFNEPYGTYAGNDIILDSSGNSLHQTISNFNIVNRLTGSDIPLTLEQIKNNIILFPDYPGISTFNESLMTTASFYDNINPNLITKLVPSHYFLEGNEEEDFSTTLGTFNQNITTGKMPKSLQPKSAQLLTIFLLVWAKYFDEIKIFIDGISDLKHLDYEGFNITPDKFLHEIGKMNGINLPSLFKGSNVEQFIDGINLEENTSQSQLSLLKIQNTIWRQILVSLPYLKLTKGTLESVKSIFRSSGIEPDNLFTIREYGGNSVRDIDESREKKIDVLKFLNFSGSLASVTSTYDSQGRPNNKPTIKSGYLSGSRIEAGQPNIKGAYVGNKTFHGMSNNSSDGLFTSGSFTYEGQYYFNKNLTHATTQSLARLHATGSVVHDWESVIANLTYNKTDKILSLDFHDSPTESTKSSLSLNDLDLINNEIWNISFGYDRQKEYANSGSIFLRAGRSESGKIYDLNTTSSFVTGSEDSIFRNISSDYNASGSFISIGEQIPKALPSKFLNSENLTTQFSGMLSNVRFYSKTNTENEFRSHIKDPQSLGVENPLINYLFEKTRSGSFEKLRLQTDSKQGSTGSNSTGNFRLFDFTQNNLHLEAAGFELNKTVVNPIFKEYSMLSSNFDISIADSKVRIRSLSNQNRINEHKYAQFSPIFEVMPSELTIDDPRFSIDMSVMRGLNEQIMKIFSDFDFMSNSLGKTNLLFSETYPDLKQLREIYFNNVLDKIDLGKYSEIFKWIDNALTDLIVDFIPHTTKFKGINLIYENHVLDRNRFKYYFDQIYRSGDNITSLTNSIDQASDSDSISVDGIIFE
jgi:hypothetical protein